MLLRINHHLINMMAVMWVEFSDGSNGDSGALVHFSDQATLQLSPSDVTALETALTRINQAQVQRVTIPFDPRRMN